jgi:hypothetical protein
MRAIQIEQFGDPAQVLRVVDIEEPPPPGPHEVLLSVEVSPLNKTRPTGCHRHAGATTPAPHTRRRGGREILSRPTYPRTMRRSAQTPGQNRIAGRSIHRLGAGSVGASFA